MCVHGLNVGVIARGTAGGREPVVLFFAIDLVIGYMRRRCKTPISLSSVFTLFFILFFLSNFINRPSVLFWGGDVAVVHKYRHIRILGPGTSFVFCSNFINRPSVLRFFGDAALVHKYQHIHILGPGTSKLSCIYLCGT